MQKWEYKIVDRWDEKTFNQLGENGWELVNITAEGEFTRHQYAAFKRPKP